eukprot:12933685-Prorocentrum_lima.AAC.1
MTRRQMGLVVMEVANRNLWVIAPPCAGLSEFARRTRHDSTEAGRRICTWNDYQTFWDIQYESARISQHTLDTLPRPSR